MQVIEAVVIITQNLTCRAKISFIAVMLTRLHVRTQTVIRKRGFIQRASVYVLVTLGELNFWVYISIMV